LLEYPISLYTGWIAVATVVNVALNLYSLDWNNWGISGVTWTIIMMVICAVIALVVALRRQDIVLPLVFVW
jgi:ABC-type multidrug transport system permease subunit